MTKTSVKNSQSAMKLTDHIKELGGRLLISAIALLIAGSITYLFYAPILDILRSPLGAPLYYNNPAGSFAFIMKICFMGGITITIPVIIYNLIRFIQPAFKKTISNKKIYAVAAASSLFAIAGAVFAFTCILPGTLQFFAGFQSEGIKALISADNYLNFVINIIITFVMIFQLPLLIMFIDNIKPLKPKKLIKLEKWVILGSLVIALVTPFTYDLITSLLIALPIIVLYNLSILAVLAKHSYKKRVLTTSLYKTKKHNNVQTDFMPELMPSFNQLVDELNIVKPVSSIVEITPQKKTFMDIAPVAKFNQRQFIAKDIPITKTINQYASKHVKLISDIRIRPGSNRVLA